MQNIYFQRTCENYSNSHIIDKIDKFVRSFPEAELAQEGLEYEARTEYDFNESCIKKRLHFANKKIFKGPSNEEIKTLWSKKKEERISLDLQCYKHF